MMKRLALLPVIALALAACSETTTGPTPTPTPRFTTTFGSSTSPSGAHYQQGFGEPVCSILGVSVSCTGTEIGGVGNTDATLLVTVIAEATVQCRNKGGNIVEVKSQLEEETSSDDHTDVRNGTLYVSAFTVAGPTDEEFLAAATCPNGNWTKLLLGSPVVRSYQYSLTFDGFNSPAISITGP